MNAIRPSDASGEQLHANFFNEMKRLLHGAETTIVVHDEATARRRGYFEQEDGSILAIEVQFCCDFPQDLNPIALEAMGEDIYQKAKQEGGVQYYAKWYENADATEPHSELAVEDGNFVTTKGLLNELLDDTTESKAMAVNRVAEMLQMVAVSSKLDPLVTPVGAYTADQEADAIKYSELLKRIGWHEDISEEDRLLIGSIRSLCELIILEQEQTEGVTGDILTLTTARIDRGEIWQLEFKKPTKISHSLDIAPEISFAKTVVETVPDRSSMLCHQTMFTIEKDGHVWVDSNSNVRDELGRVVLSDIEITKQIEAMSLTPYERLMKNISYSPENDVASGRRATTADLIELHHDIEELYSGLRSDD